MRLLKSRGFAVSVSVAVMILSLVIGVTKTVNTKAKAVNRVFENGAWNDGYGVQNYLNKMDEYAGYLVKICAKYDELSDSAEAINDARVSLTKAHSPSEQYQAVNDLIDSVQTLDYSMEGVLLSNRDSEAYSKYSANFESERLKLVREGAAFNEKVDAFYDKYMGGVPVKLFGWFIGQNPAERFQA